MNPTGNPLTLKQIVEQHIGTSDERSVVDAEDSDTFIEFTSFLLKTGILPEFKLEKEDRFRFNLCHRFPSLKRKFNLGSFQVKAGTNSNKTLTESDWTFSFNSSVCNPVLLYRPDMFQLRYLAPIPLAKSYIKAATQQVEEILVKNNVPTSKVAAFLILKAHTFYADPSQLQDHRPKAGFVASEQNGFIAREQARRMNLCSEASILEFLKTDMSIEEIAYWLAIGVPAGKALASKGIPISYLNRMDPVGL